MHFNMPTKNNPQNARGDGGGDSVYMLLEAYEAITDDTSDYLDVLTCRKPLPGSLPVETTVL